LNSPLSRVSPESIQQKNRHPCTTLRHLVSVLRSQATVLEVVSVSR
jgi:hypothetical protein